MATDVSARAPKGIAAAKLAFVAACLCVSACESPTALIDAALTFVEERTRADLINAAFLDQKNGLFRDIAVDVYESEVLLTGSVIEPEVKTDTTINLQINAAFLDQKNGLFRDIAVDVYESEVLLTGSVIEPEVKRTASALVAGIPNVRKVLNEVQVTKGNGIRETSADITLETKIKVALRRTSGVHSVNMRWRSVGGTVYLFGRALSKAEQETAITTINGIDGVKSLVNVQKIVPLGG